MYQSHWIIAHLKYTEIEPIAPGRRLCDITIGENCFFAAVVGRDQFSREESLFRKWAPGIAAIPFIQVDQSMHSKMQIAHFAHVRVNFLVFAGSCWRGEQ